MKLQKSFTGKILTAMYYIASGIVILILMILIMNRVGIIAGLAVSFALGIVCGIIGGELEFIQHNNMLLKKYTRKEKPEERNKIIPFPGRKKM